MIRRSSSTVTEKMVTNLISAKIRKAFKCYSGSLLHSKGFKEFVIRRKKEEINQVFSISRYRFKYLLDKYQQNNQQIIFNLKIIDKSDTYQAEVANHEQ